MPPYPSMASQKPPAPKPRSNRPSDNRSKVAAVLARTAGGRNGRLATSGNTRSDVVVLRIADISAKVST